jgi:hypothetical protein
MSDYARWAESDQSSQAQLDQALRVLVAKAEMFGLPEKDVRTAQEFLEYNEPGCAFEHVVTQLYEYGTPISAEYYQLLQAIAKSMQLPEQHFMYAKELIK